MPDTLLGPEGTGNRSFETDARELMLMGVSVGARSVNVLPGLPASQVIKSTRWMPWHQKPMKDVGACEKPWGVGNRTVIQGCPNGETRLESCPVTSA